MEGVLWVDISTELKTRLEASAVQNVFSIKILLPLELKHILRSL